MKRRQVTTVLSDAEEARLNALAKRHRCLSRHGVTAGQPSWRTMLQDIAQGYLVVVRPDAKSAPADRAGEREFSFHENSPPKWWDASEGLMNVHDLEKKTGATREKLESVGFRIGGSTARPPVGWTKWATVPAPAWWVDRDDRAGMSLEEAKKVSGLDEVGLEAMGLTIAGMEVVL